MFHRPYSIPPFTLHPTSAPHPTISPAPLSLPSVGYAFKNAGSVTAKNGWAGYYDTQLTTGEPVLGSSDGDAVNNVMSYDPTVSPCASCSPLSFPVVSIACRPCFAGGNASPILLLLTAPLFSTAQLSGTNAFWGDRGGENVMEPAQWHHPAPLTVSQMSDGDWVPDSWTQGGPSHSSRERPSHESPPFSCVLCIVRLLHAVLPGTEGRQLAPIFFGISIEEKNDRKCRRPTTTGGYAAPRGAPLPKLGYPQPFTSNWTPDPSPLTPSLNPELQP